MCGNLQLAETGDDSPRRSRNLSLPEIIWETVKAARCGVSRELIDSCAVQLEAAGVILSVKKRNFLTKELIWMANKGTDHNLGKRTGELIDVLQKTE